MNKRKSLLSELLACKFCRRFSIKKQIGSDLTEIETETDITLKLCVLAFQQVKQYSNPTSVTKLMHDQAGTAQTITYKKCHLK